jgi:hypothetical protein
MHRDVMLLADLRSEPMVEQLAMYADALYRAVNLDPIADLARAPPPGRPRQRGDAGVSEERNQWGIPIRTSPLVPPGRALIFDEAALARPPRRARRTPAGADVIRAARRARSLPRRDAARAAHTR